MDKLTEEQETMWDILKHDIMKRSVDGANPPKAGDMYYDIASGKFYTFGGLNWYEE